MTRRTLLLVLVAAVILTACMNPMPQRTATLLPTPTTKGGAATSATKVTTPATPTATIATAQPTPPRTPSAATLAIPTEFANNHADLVATLQQAQPGIRIERVTDSGVALSYLQNKKANWAITTRPQSPATARALCLSAYVPIVHFSSPLDDVTSERLRSIYQRKDWPGVVLYSGDTAILRRVLGIDVIAAPVIALPSWKAVVERVAGDRTAIAFVPWSEVDARVKTLSLDGKSIAVNGIRGYGYGDGWWLNTAGAALTPADEDLARKLSCAVREPVTFLAGGDILMGWFVNDVYIKKEGPEYLFRRVADLFRSADIAFGNLENPISSRGVMENKGLMFRAPPEAVKGLTYAGIDVVNLANNHIGDYGPQAVLDTLDILKQNGIGYAGAGRNRAEARSPWITTTKGITIAILAYNEIEPGYFAATDSHPGSAWIEPDNVYAEIRKTKAQADFVIVSFHWGIEYTPHPNARQQEIARGAAQAGAGLIVGHHPHVVQGVGFFGSVFVDYSIGDFVYSQPTRPATGEGIILRAVIDGQTLKQVQMIPIYIDKAQPRVISPVEAKLMMERIFDATSDYKGLPPSTEAALAPAAGAALPTAQASAPAGSLTFVALNGQQADVVIAGSGNTATRLTADGALNDRPAWSPDGKRLAFSSARDGSVDIFVTAADSHGTVNITRNPAWDDYPTWSPDGNKIAFSSNRDGPYKIYIMNADGSGVRRLTSGDSWDTTPAWSPDGTKIAFVSDRSGTFQIYTVDVDGSNLRQLTNYPNLNAFPSWSPDGKQIVYQSYQDESAAQGDDAIQDRDYEIMVIPSRGGVPRRLTDNQSADIQPAWSPDGRRIAFASDRSGSFQIYTMNPDGSGVTAMTGGAGGFVSPAWTP